MLVFALTLHDIWFLCLVSRAGSADKVSLFFILRQVNAARHVICIHHVFPDFSFVVGKVPKIFFALEILTLTNLPVQEVLEICSPQPCVHPLFGVASSCSHRWKIWTVLSSRKADFAFGTKFCGPQKSVSDTTGFQFLNTCPRRWFNLNFWQKQNVPFHEEWTGRKKPLCFADNGDKRCNSYPQRHLSNSCECVCRFLGAVNLSLDVFNTQGVREEQQDDQ